LGYAYIAGFATVKTECAKDPVCDNLAYMGYDGMIFVANYYNMSTVVAGWWAICFPNPISN